MQWGDEFFETLRRSYKPTKILTLFVGESRPANGTFFYLGDSGLFKYMREAFRGGDNFLCDFRHAGFFLDDLVTSPVNKQTKPQRRKRQRDSVDDLASRISEHSPVHVVIVGRGIEEQVAAALDQAEMTGVPRDVVSFPANGQQQNFLREMQELIPRLPRLL